MENKVLSQEQIEHFLAHGFVRVPGAIPPEKVSAWTDTLWKRLGYDPNDKSTWLQKRINMPAHKREPARTFSPIAWRAICELLGGEERVDAESALWSDGFIVNLGLPEYEGKDQNPKELDNWHVDGDFFVHFLDSPEQGLLVIPVFSDIEEGGGGTMITPDGIGIIAKHLMENPQGVSPKMVPRGEEPKHTGITCLSLIISQAQSCSTFHEMTGKTGDVILMHPFMLHSASKNRLRIPRIITNPKVSLKEPFNFDRENADEYSIVEKKTLMELGVDRLRGWKIKGDREKIVPERMQVQRAMKELEEKRLRGENSSAGPALGYIENDLSEILTRTSKKQAMNFGMVARLYMRVWLI
ncbi:hypothetical protein EDC01DRAFT_715880 [Geopyxis carbonaria]|nr:hypothetical protein EDC01DRAFT_715880 [Geopyxis carbonaria]